MTITVSDRQCWNILLDDRVSVAATKSEAVDTGSPWHAIEQLWPWRQSGWDFYMMVEGFYRWVQTVEKEVGSNASVADALNGLNEPCEPCSSFRVTNDRFDLFKSVLGVWTILMRLRWNTYRSDVEWGGASTHVTVLGKALENGTGFSRIT
jgi:hypothetical protein